MAATFRLRVVSLLRTLYDGEVSSIFLVGDEGEYELLPHHYPLMGALMEGEVKIAGELPIRLKTGVVMFDNNTCIIIVEEFDIEKKLYADGAGGQNPDAEPQTQEAEKNE